MWDIPEQEGQDMAGTIFPLIEQKRADLGTSKVRMADKLGISVQALDNKMTGKSEFTGSEIRTLAIWWNTSADYLMSEAVEPSKSN